MTATLATQQVATAALAQIATALGHLPGAYICLNSIFPTRLDISLHDSLADFEAWREALGIPTDAIDYAARPSGMCLKASGGFGGADIELIGFAPGITTEEAVTQ